MNKRLFGIDVSTHNGELDFATLKNEVDFIIIRVGYGVMTANNNEGVDKQFKRNVEGCIKHGIPFGFYHASYCYSDERAKLEAESFIKTIKGYKPEYPVYFDFEGFSVDYAKQMGVNVTKAQATKWVDIWCKTLEKAGYYVGIYTNIDYYNRYFDKSLWEKYDKWVAHWYVNRPAVKTRLWQTGSNGKLKGATKGINRVDTNYCYYDYPNVIKNAGLNGYKKPPSKPKETNEQLAIKEIKKVLEKYKL